MQMPGQVLLTEGAASFNERRSANRAIDVWGMVRPEVAHCGNSAGLVVARSLLLSHHATGAPSNARWACEVGRKAFTTTLPEHALGS